MRLGLCQSKMLNNIKMRSAAGKLIFLCIIMVVAMEGARRLGKIWSWWREPPARWLGVDSCPLCYGLDACPELEPRGVDLACDGGLASVLALIGDKNVLFGCSGNRGSVVIKKLGHDRQLEALTDKACSILLASLECNFDVVPDLYAFLRRKILEKISVENSFIEPDEVGTVLCPGGDIDKIIAPFLRDEDKSTPLNRILMTNVWTIFNINAEPIILKYLTETTKKWPIAQYLGACGRTVMETYAGRPLREYLSEPWPIRARIAINLLKAADTFTFNHPEFRFYLTDISADNIVVSSNKTWDIVFVDLENVIIADVGKGFDMQDDFMTNHTSEAIECRGRGCLAYSTEKICQHHLSDHNHYAISRFIAYELLRDGFPDYALKISPELPQLLHECHSPMSNNADRFMTVSILQTEIMSVLNL